MDDLKQIGKVVEEKIQASEARLTRKIEVSQEETIDTLSEVIRTGYNMHEGRIRAIEDHVDIQHPKKN